MVDKDQIRKPKTANNSRGFPILNFESFRAQIMNRFYPLIRWEANLESDFILLINILDRSPKAHDIDTVPDVLIYAGVQEQEKFFREKKVFPRKLEENLIALDRGQIFIESTLESSGFYEQFSNGLLELKDFKVKNLKRYFKTYLSRGEFDNKLQEHEYPVLSHYFDIATDHYLSLPIIQFGDLDGVVHIIFRHADRKKLDEKAVVKNLIRQFTKAYEELLIAWDLEGDNITINSLLVDQLGYLQTKKYAEAAQTNPIYRELNYRQYYQDSRTYLLDRVKQNNAVPAYLKNEHRKRAIIAILIDSYAHNISAHSLTVLKWWFQQRAVKNDEVKEMIKGIAAESSFKTGWGSQLRDFLAQKFPDEYTPAAISEGIKTELARWIHNVENRRKNGKYLPVRDQLLPLAEQLYPLFKFLLEKGAFWSGITRDQQFGGEIRTLFDVLWNDFIKNPLYLGTIAYSEGITRLNIRIRIYSGRKWVGKDQGFRRVYELEKDSNGTPLSGNLATINVGSLGKDQELVHDYITKGDLHGPLRRKLRECQVFFPGGMVGKHSFFTLIENEIRNVKHFPPNMLADMQKNGLNLVIALRPGSLSGNAKNYKNKSLYKVGVWLDHMSKLYSKDEHLAIKRLGGLRLDIITDITNQARLGGTFQDKICAAMLFNNTFISVEWKKTERDERYYPWVRAAFSEGIAEDGSSEIDFEIREKNLELAKDHLRDPKGNAEFGYFKKYFHVWQGAPFFYLESLEGIELENVARFKIVMIKKEKWKANVRKFGVIRVLSGMPTRVDWLDAYQIWISMWLKIKKGRISLIRGETEIGHIIYNKREVLYFSQDDYFAIDDDLQEEYGGYKPFSLKFEHASTPMEQDSSKNFLAIRSHGILAQKFFDNLSSINEFDNATISQAHLIELLEVIETKICIFDKRVAERIFPNRRKFLEHQMRCTIHEEDELKWEEVKKEGLQNYHFIIMHLSFIEALPDSKGKRYGEEGIVEFIEEQMEGQLSDNCLLVVTTGRGREQWWRSLQKSKYRAYTTFRPVESLIEAVESARAKNDDIELKYNLVKTLFGS